MMNNRIMFVLLWMACTTLLHAQDTIAVGADWNLIGAISTVPLSQVQSDPPGIIISSYFGYTPNGYVASDTLKKGSGYWVRANQPGIIALTPQSEFSSMSVIPDTIEVNAEWNLVGASSTIPIDQLRSEPTGIIHSSYFGYSSIGYTSEDTLQKGKGYWVKVSQAGQIISGSTVNNPSVPSNPDPPDGMVNASTSSVVMRWSCVDPENDTMKYDIYYGVDNPPSTRVKLNGIYQWYGVTGLNYATRYYWRIVARDSHGYETSGPVWSFTTKLNTSTACGGITSVSYAGKTYHTVSIENQCWFKEILISEPWLIV